jgi:hypothetical protein
MDTDTTEESIPTRIKNHLKDHKFAYTASAVAIAAIALQQSNARAFLKFLDEKGIDRLEYLNPEMLAESQQS